MNSPAVIQPDHEIRWGGDQSQSSNTRTSDGALIRQHGDWTPPCHIIFKFLIPSLLAVVAVKYQAISKDPSTTRPFQTWSFLISIFLYSLVLFAANQSRKLYDNYLKCLDRFALACVVVSSLSLIALLLPRFPGLLVLCTSWALTVLISAFPVVRCTYNGLFTRIKTPLDSAICSARKLFTGWKSGEQQPPKGTSSHQPPPHRTRPPV